MRNSLLNYIVDGMDDIVVLDVGLGIWAWDDVVFAVVVRSGSLDMISMTTGGQPQRYSRRG